MNDAVIAAITRRVSAGRFAPDGNVSDKQIHDLAELATRAPTAYNLQNWRMIAVRSAAVKARLKAVAFGQAKIEESAVTFILCGQAPSHRELGERLLPAVEAGFLPSSVVENWIAAVKQSYDGNAMMQRDEAIRSATLGAAFLIFAAEAYGLASCPMGGFDAERLARAFMLEEGETPLLLVAIGHGTRENWPQKPRMPVARFVTTV